MAHEIYTARNGTASMAFVGETPWHGLGQRLTESATIEEWTREAGFEWEALQAPMFFDTGAGRREVAGYRAIVRSDTGESISVMGDRYQIVQPRQVIEFFRDLTESQGWHLHTAGVLDGGRKLWALAKNGTTGEVVPGDRVNANLLLATSLDGSTATVAGMTDIRVVCANTLGMARRAGLKGYGAGKQAARVSHRSIFDADSVKQQIGVARDVFAERMEQYAKLAKLEIGTTEARDILREIFGAPTEKRLARAAKATQAVIAKASAHDGADDLASLLSRPMRPRDDDGTDDARADLARILAGDVREQKSVARCLALFAGEGRGALHPGVAGTGWGLLQSVTEHIDHEQGRSADSRLSSAWFGRGNDFKQETLAALLERA